ncbi:MAG: response regulator [Anaerolineae bacterium]|nr:response regulator [Anaerolineae bacterium]
MANTVLIVENEPFVLDAMEEILSTVGFKSICVRDGNRGIDTYKERSGEIDIVILDMNLPGMTGSEVYRVMQQVNPNVKVIVSSGYDELDVVERLGESKPASILKKPFNAQMLLDQVQSVLSS